MSKACKNCKHWKRSTVQLPGYAKGTCSRVSEASSLALPLVLGENDAPVIGTPCGLCTNELFFCSQFESNG